MWHPHAYNYHFGGLQHIYCTSRDQCAAIGTLVHSTTSYLMDIPLWMQPSALNFEAKTIHSTSTFIKTRLIDNIFSHGTLEVKFESLPCPARLWAFQQHQLYAWRKGSNHNRNLNIHKLDTSSHIQRQVCWLFYPVFKVVQCKSFLFVWNPIQQHWDF